MQPIRDVLHVGRLREKLHVKQRLLFHRRKSHFDQPLWVCLCVHREELPSVMLEAYDHQEDIEGHQPKKVHDLATAECVYQSRTDAKELIVNRRSSSSLTFLSESEEECQRWADVCTSELTRLGVLSSLGGIFVPVDASGESNYVYADSRSSRSTLFDDSDDSMYLKTLPSPLSLPSSSLDDDSIASSSPSPPSALDKYTSFLAQDSVDEDVPLPTKTKTTPNRQSLFGSHRPRSSTEGESSTLKSIMKGSRVSPKTGKTEEIGDGIALLVQSARALSFKDEFDKRHLREVSLALHYVVENLCFVRFDGKIWLAGWTALANRSVGTNLRIGDRLVKVNKHIVTNATLVPHVFFENSICGQPIQLTMLDQPNVKTLVVKKPESPVEPFGIEFYKGTNRIEQVVEGSPAWRDGVRATVPSFVDSELETPAVVTEINGARLNLFAKNKQAQRHIEKISSGARFEISLQPLDFVKAIQKCMKGVPKHEYVLASFD